MRRGLVVGKFSPLHLGHEFLISQARQACDELIVLSYTKPEYEGCDRDRRETWLRTRFPDVVTVVLDDSRLNSLCKERSVAQAWTIPADVASDDEHRQFVAWLCREVLHQTVDVVFTSEDYGDGFAAVLAACLRRPVEHVCVDRERRAIPVSGTRIRANPHACRAQLSPEVYASFVRRICILGGESSGKTTLATLLAGALETVWVAEYGRELWVEKHGRPLFEDMLHIGQTQAQREDAMAGRANRILICDTSPLTTVFYSTEMFGRVDEELMRLAERTYDLTFLCVPDFEHVQDGTRQGDAFRLHQQRWYGETLRNSGTAIHELSGPLQRRLARALDLTDKYLSEALVPYKLFAGEGAPRQAPAKASSGFEDMDDDIPF